MKKFPNGINAYLETFYEVASYIEEKVNAEPIDPDKPNDIVQKTHDEGGRGELYVIAEQWTDEFESRNKGRQWDGEFFDEIEQFLQTKNQSL